MTTALLALSGSVALLVLGGGLASALRPGGGDRKRLARRLAQLSAPRTTIANPAARTLSMQVAPSGIGARALAALQRIVGYDPNVPSRPSRIWISCVVSLAMARAVDWLATALLGQIGWALFPVIGFMLQRSYFTWCARRWRNKLFEQFPDALATIVRAVRVGVSLPEGIRRVAEEAAEPTASIFVRIADEMAIGTPLPDALAASTSRTGLPEYRFFATALVLQSRTGGGLAVTLDGLADVIRKRVAVKVRGRALSGEAKASAAILAVMPIITAIMLVVVSPAYIMDLFTDPFGRTLLAAAILTESVGILVMRTMIVRALS